MKCSKEIESPRRKMRAKNIIIWKRRRNKIIAIIISKRRLSRKVAFNCVILNFSILHHEKPHFRRSEAKRAPQS